MNEQHSQLEDFFGAPKSSAGEGYAWKNHQIKEGEANVFRIAPPIKSLKDAGVWSVYEALHYGYTVPNPEAPDQPRHRPFRCIQKRDRRNNMMIQDCPECDRLERKTREIDALKKDLLSKGKTEADVAEHIKAVSRLARNFNLDKKHYVLAKNIANEWGVLKLPHRAMQALRKVVDEYIKDNKGMHPFAAGGGVWIRFSRSGKNLQTEYYATIESESLGGGRFQHKAGTLSALDVEGLRKCPDLATLNDNKILTYDQIAALAQSENDPVITQQVFGQPTRRNSPASTPAVAPTTTPVAPAVQQTAPATATTTPEVDPEEALLLAQLAAIKAKKSAAPAQTPAPAQATATKAMPANMEELEPDEFLALFPDPNVKV